MSAIRDTQDVLEQVFTDGGLNVQNFNENVRSDRVQVYWVGSTPSATGGELLMFQVDVIPQDWQDVGDSFVEAWNLVAQASRFAPQGITISYDSVPLGAKKSVSFASFNVIAARQFDARGF